MKSINQICERDIMLENVPSQSTMTELLGQSDDDKGDETFIKAWLRAHYTETIRETKAGAVNKDFDIIGGS